MNTVSTQYFEIQHVTSFEYAKPVQRASMLLRLQPQSDNRQKVLQFSYDFQPHAQPLVHTDPFGNICHLIDFYFPAQPTVVIQSCSEIETSHLPVNTSDANGARWEDFKTNLDFIAHWEFLAASDRVYDCAQLQGFLNEYNIVRADTPLASLIEAAECLYQNIQYQPGSTEVNSTIEDCLKLRSGVCQDFTHILLAIGRNWGIPARYVSGYLHLFPDSKQVITENASHAWGEFYIPELGWIGIDATNDTIVDSRYVRVSKGRDYNDVAPTRGVIFGGGNASLQVNVTLTNRQSEPRLNGPPGEAQ